MKNKFIMFFTYSLFFSVNGYCQFNTVLQKKDIPKAEPVLATTENKLIEEKEKAVVVNDALTTERLAYWKQSQSLRHSSFALLHMAEDLAYPHFS